MKDQVKEYYVGLDVGSNSVGWAVTDQSYHIPRYKSNAMWGVRLFSEAAGAAERRTARTNRRRLARRNMRLELLREIFAPYIYPIDPGFFERLKDSYLAAEEKSPRLGCYALFNDKNFTDKDYHRLYPTVYHLRQALLTQPGAFDVRLVYLALHHIVKSRGHFLIEGELNSQQNLGQALTQVVQLAAEEYGANIAPTDPQAFEQVLLDQQMSITAKKRALKAAMGKRKEEDELLSCDAVCDLLAGAKVKLGNLFKENQADWAKDSIALKTIDSSEEVCRRLPLPGQYLLESLRTLFDTARMAQITGEYQYICQAKVALYNQNRDQLRLLKNYVGQFAPQKRQLVFHQQKKGLNNYAAYSRYKSTQNAYTCKQEDFCKFLRKELPDYTGEDKAYRDMLEKIRQGTFLPRLRSGENGIIPHQLHRRELVAILQRAGEYLPWLNQPQEDKITPAKKIECIFDYKIPYYVGPLNPKSPRSWVVRDMAPITPWNFKQQVNLAASANAFMQRLVGRCTYTGQPVLPKDSLLYSEYMVRNEINTLRCNGQLLPPNIKEQLYQDLFVASSKKVTKKTVQKYLESCGYMPHGGEITGVDQVLKSSLKSYHDFKDILQRTGNTQMVEQIIQDVLVYSGDKAMLRRLLQQQYPDLLPGDIDKICRLNYRDWGRLSRQLLCDIYTVNVQGEAKNIMDCLRQTNQNLMQLVQGDFDMPIQQYRQQHTPKQPDIWQQMEDMYLPAPVRRSLWQAIKIVDDICHVQGGAPQKIMVEVARGPVAKLKNTRTTSRKDQLLAWYKANPNADPELVAQLAAEEETQLRSDKVYLYYTQLGRCAYTGQAIDLTNLKSSNSNFDIDHIFPQSRIRDDSLDNRVLVNKTVNHAKQNVYPIPQDIRDKMQPYWQMLYSKGLISEKKYARLTRSTPLTAEELSAFVQRQLTETQQSTRALATLLAQRYPNTTIVYSKAQNVTDFRQRYQLPKCREINDVHHAKDAYLNIVVGNVYHTRFTARFFANIQRENYSLNAVFNHPVAGAWNPQQDLPTVKAVMQKNNILFTRMPCQGAGPLFDLNLVAAGGGQLPAKQGRNLQKYGGYNKPGVAYFAIGEYPKGKKMQRQILPVLLYGLPLYQKDPDAYFARVLQLPQVRLLVKKILPGTLMQIDDSRFHIAGKTGSQIVVRHAAQLALGDNWVVYIKAVLRYLDRCTAAKQPLPVDPRYDRIDPQRHLQLYDLLLQKFESPAYRSFFATTIDCLRQNRRVFAGLSMQDQSYTLRELLRGLKCDAQTMDLTKIGGVAHAGLLQKSTNITGKKVQIICKSPTGLRARTLVVG